MKKVLKALKFLKIINPYYSSIKIIDSCELQIDEIVNNDSDSDSDMEINNSMLEHQPFIRLYKHNTTTIYSATNRKCNK